MADGTSLQEYGDLKIKEGKFEKDRPTVKFPAKITKESDGTLRAEVAIKGFRFDQSGTGDPQVFDVYAMQVGGVKPIGDGDTVTFSISCEAKGKTTAKWEGHLNVLVIADIAESPPTGSPPTGPTGSPPTGPTGSPPTGPTGSPPTGPTGSPPTG